MAEKQQGLGILDISPKFEDVPVGDGLLRVYGISAEDIVALLQRYPDSQNWFSAGGFKKSALKEIGPAMLASVIAAACHAGGNPQAEERAKSFSIEEQMDIIEATKRLTFKAGFGPFVQRLAEIARSAAYESSGKVSDTNSQAQSTNSLPTDTSPVTSGS